MSVNGRKPVPNLACVKYREVRYVHAKRATLRIPREHSALCVIIDLI